MKHVADAKKLIDQGKSQSALDVLDNLLGLAPRNHEALRLKAQILDSQGRFDESLLLLRDLSRFDGISSETIQDLERRTLEEREVSVYSELTPEGRWYFAFPAAQLWISLYGFFGCAFFLLMSPRLLGQDPAAALPRIALGFFVFVALPWIALLVVHLVGIKKVLVGLSGLRICTRFSERQIAWESVDAAVLEHSPDLRSGKLFLVLYGKAPNDTGNHSSGDNDQARRFNVLARFNVSQNRSVVRARRHFVRAVLTHIDVVSYVTLESSTAKGVVHSDTKRAG